MELNGLSRRSSAPIRFVWNNQFSERQPISYFAEDLRLTLAQSDTVGSAFLKFWSNYLDPPGFKFRRLAAFLEQGDIRDLKDRTRIVTLSRLALLDDRRDPCGLNEAQPGEPETSNGMKRSWTSVQYTEHPPPGVDRYRKALDERGLYDKLCEKVRTPAKRNSHIETNTAQRSSNHAERRTL